jgi:hypothetical protein
MKHEVMVIRLALLITVFESGLAQAEIAFHFFGEFERGFVGSCHVSIPVN